MRKIAKVKVIGKTIAQSPERKKNIELELARFIEILKTSANLLKIILFGSVASGNIHQWSDIDLVIIEDTNLSFYERIKRIRKLLRPRIGTDLMVYTPVEFEFLCEKKPFFKNEIVGRGKILYERAL